MKFNTQDEVLAILKKRQGNMSDREFAKTLGVSGAYMSDIYAKKREPGKSVLSKIGLCKHIVYVRMK